MNEQTQKPGPPRIYVFTTVAVTLFLLGLVFLRTPIDGFVAQTVIEVDTVVMDELRAAGISASQLQSAITQQAVLADVYPKATEESLQQLVNVIWVRESEVYESGNQAFNISHMGSTRAEANRATELLAQKAIANLQAEAVSASKVSRDDPDQFAKLKDSIIRESEAWRTLDKSVESTFHELAEKIESIESTPMPKLNSEEPIAPKFVREKTTIPNPEWANLNNEVNGLSRQSQILLTRLTPEHPQVKQLAIRINQARLALAKVPEVIEVEQEDPLDFSASSDKGPEPDAISKTTSSLTKEAVLSAVASYEQLLSDYEKSRMNSDSILSELSVPQTSNEVFPAAEVATISQPAKIVRREGGLPSRLVILAITIASLLIASIAAMLAGAKVPAVFYNAQQVEHELAIPVAATVPVGQSRTTARGGIHWGQSIHWLTKSCEVILAVIVFALLIFTLLDSPTFDSIASDPFGTISETVARAQKFRI